MASKKIILGHSNARSRFELGHLASLLLAAALITPACASDDGDEDENGTAGATSTGGGDDGGSGGVTGTGGSGGTTAPTSVCDGNTSKPESATVWSHTAGMGGAGDEPSVINWDIFASSEDMDSANGAELTIPESGSFEDPPALEQEAGEHHVRMAGTGWITYGAGMNYNLEGCKDLTDYTGVRFSIQATTTRPEDQEQPPEPVGDDVVNFRVITAGSHLIIEEGGMNVGGDCDASVMPNSCFMPPQIDLDVTPGSWVEVEVPFDDLVTPAGANPGSEFTGTNAMLLGWYSANGDFDIAVKNVEYYE